LVLLLSAGWALPVKAANFNVSDFIDDGNYNVSGDYTGNPGSDYRRPANVTIVVGGNSGVLTGVNATDNVVNVTTNLSTYNVTVVGGGTINSSVSVTNNTVNIFSDGVVGANWTDGNYSGNAVGGVLNGTAGGTAEVRGNTVNLNGGHVWSQILGGMGANATTRDNLVNITGGYVHGDIYGGVTIDGKGSFNNTVEISSLNFTRSVHGGSGSSADANKVNISNANVSERVVGGKAKGLETDASAFASADGNTVYVNSANVTGDVFGGFFTEDVYHLVFTNVSVSGNNVTVINSSVGNFTGVNEQPDMVVGGFLEAAPENQSIGVVNNNRVEIFGNETNIKGVAGGLVQHNSTSNITNNIVIIDIEEGKIGNYSVTVHDIGRVVGGRAMENFSGEITGNEVDFRSGQASSVIGGYTHHGMVSSPTNMTGLISDNEVNIRGGKIANFSASAVNQSIVAGGYTGINSSGTISNNRVFFHDGEALLVYGGGAGIFSSTNITGNNVTIFGGVIGNTTESYLGIVAGASAGANSSGNISNNYADFQDGNA
jgi:hypothetical protein